MATGRKTVVVGQVIDPTTWGNPLWDQSVQQFASAADRTAQFPAPLPGAVTWLVDVGRLEVWDGARWTDPHGTTVWTDMAAFSANWGQLAPGAAVTAVGTRNDKWGNAQLRGRLSRTGVTFTGVPGTLFVLPVAQRPATARFFTATTNGTPVTIQITNDGAVACNTSATWTQNASWISFDGMEWQTT